MAQNKETKSTETPWFGIAIVVSCCLVPLMPFIFTIGGGLDQFVNGHGNT